MCNNENLKRAKENANDEFYTRYEDIELELKDYDFNGKRVYCNCDSIESNFVEYFMNNFKKLGLVSLTATSYNDNGRGSIIKYDGDKLSINKLNGNGDYRSEECINLLRSVDIVVTNPPFSLFRDFVDLMHHVKMDYIIIGTENAVVYKNFYPYIERGTDFVGNHLVKYFISPEGEVVPFGNICWWTNVRSSYVRKKLVLKRRPSKGIPKFDNYDALSIDRVSQIPLDYKKPMGVPVTFLKHHLASQFQIIGLTSSSQSNSGVTHKKNTSTAPYLNGKKKYARLIIKKVA